MTAQDSSAKTARLETRVSAAQKDLIERAACYSGRTVSDFVVAHVEVAAKKVVEEYERLHLDQEQSRVLVESLLSPTKPNRRLSRAAADYRRRVESR